MTALITSTEISSLARPCYCDAVKAVAYIMEAQANDLRLAVGDALYSWLGDETHRATPEGVLLLNGGTFTDDGGDHVFRGLKTALAYYAYARITMGGNMEVTRVGSINRESGNSSRSDWQERNQTARDCRATALNEVWLAFTYARTTATLAPLVKKKKPRYSVSVIGC